MTIKGVFGLVASTAILVSGCASKPQDVEMKVDPGVVQLSKAADEISESYRMLSYAESARVSETGIGRTLDYDAEDFPQAWQREVVLREDFYGELESFVRGLSKLAGYDEPQVIGKTPVVPIAVAINRSRKPLSEFLVDASYQSGGRALVVLDADRNRLQITYPE